MLVVGGALIVLLTWLVLAGIVIGWGLPLSVWLSPGASFTTVIRRAMWLGLGVGSVLILGLSLLVPLGSVATTVTLLLSAAVCGGVGFVLLRRHGAISGRHWRSFSWGRWAWLVCALVAAQVVLAFAILGPVTNYDTGLYHLGAITYARDYPAIPGLANLYGPLGYSTVQFSWGAAMSGTPLGENGSRLVNGLLMMLLAGDLILRLRRRVRRVGDYVLMIALVAIWGPMLAMADFWVASPTQDAAALMLSVIVVSSFSDAIAGRRGWIADGTVAVVSATVLGAVRSTMLVFAGFTVLLVIALVVWRVRQGSRADWRKFTAVSVVLTVMTLTAMTARDVVLSGWLQYPLSVVRFPVPWRAPDPTELRNATLGFHRDAADITGSIEGWDWIGPWLSRVSGYWETYLLIGLMIGVLLVMALNRGTGVRLPLRRIGIAALPSAVAVLAWWVWSPPSFRFTWGPLILLFVTPLAWMLCAYLRDRHTPSRGKKLIGGGVIAGGTAVIAFAAVATVAVRIDWALIQDRQSTTGPISFPYAIAVTPQTLTREREMLSGIRLLEPVRTDQCWLEYPLCSPNPAPGLKLRGMNLSEGFMSETH